MPERHLHEEENVRPLLKRALVVFGSWSTLRRDPLLDVALALGGERRPLPLVVEVELLTPAGSGRVLRLVLDHLDARPLTRDEDRENGRRSRRRLVIEEDGVELRFAALRDRQENGLRADQEMRIARGEQIAVA